VLFLLRLKTVLKGLILPPAGPLLVAVCGLLLLKRRPLMARGLLIVGLGSLWLLSTPVVGDVLTGLAEHYPPLDWHLAADAQAIVILGGGGQRAFAPEYAGPAAEPALLERLSYGAYVARKTGLRYHVDLHLEVDPELTVRASHDIATAVRIAIKSDLDWVEDVLVHVEPHAHSHGGVTIKQ